MPRISDLDSVGWGFFLGVLALLAGPCAVVSWVITKAEAAAMERIGLGIVSAALLAAIISWGVNELLHQRNLRRLAAEKKTEKKKERKTKKRH